ncbi:hypothetical protein LCGC14_0351690 [marine sediment metagenome]|uniref:Uncharacterized protein n=1 Tax=marine sediment metagenome TaxID=412755 RepID=A0A0F9TAT7_9ZZZZ
MSAIVVSAFCGTGKTHLCNASDRFVEFECWRYNQDKFPKNCITDIQQALGNADIIFISTNPTVVVSVIKIGIIVILVYPDLKLKDEYIDRYEKRGSSKDFISLLSESWESWLMEIGEIKGCQHIVLKQGQYISTVMTIINRS